MVNVMTLRFCLSLTALCAASTVALAQERTAGQAHDAQVNWSTLSTKIDEVNTQNKAIAASVTKLQTDVTKLQGDVNALSGRVDAAVNSINTINSKLGNIAVCGAQGKAWNGSGCVSPAVPQLASCYRVGGWYGVPVTCDPGEVVTSTCTSDKSLTCAVVAGDYVFPTANVQPRYKSKTGSYLSMWTVLTCCKLQ
jgi:outer membrane murein-binding lipoprotein Lpp